VVTLCTTTFRKYKVVQIWPGQTVTCLHTISPGHIWTTLYYIVSFIAHLCFYAVSKWWSAYAALTDWFCLMAGIPLCYIPSTDERSCVSSELLSWGVYVFINAINGLVLFTERHELNVWIQLMLIFVFLCCLGNRRAFHKESYFHVEEDEGGLGRTVW
jgi:hypothetical protein